YSPPMHPRSHPIMVSLRQLQLTLREQNLMVVCLWNCLFAVFTSCLLTAEEADVGFSASCLTTAELQQHWRAVKQEFRSVKLLFDIPTTRIIDQKISKYVVYQVVVIRSGSYDCERVAIERRYSDFLHLHQELLGRDYSHVVIVAPLLLPRLLKNVFIPRRPIKLSLDPLLCYQREERLYYLNRGNSHFLVVKKRCARSKQLRSILCWLC
uniref:Sorting nexin 20 n=1 Tax=Sinocyclocheilus rhinocerous TaxID=307959 RepID=A0A673G6R7_9TELE